jgi:hypothetical protein
VSKNGFILWLIGTGFVAVDAIVFGKYTAEPNTLFGWTGITVLCIAILSMILDNKGDDAQC